MTKALIVVDVQNDFAHPHGNLSVEGGDHVVQRVNELLEFYEHVVYTKDWHPVETGHFDQWPTHCIADTWGAEFHPALNVLNDAEVVYKGTGKDEDGYSGFSVETIGDNYVRGTGLKQILDGWGVDEVHVVGIALDVCVKDTALDAVRIGYRTFVIEDATAPVTAEGGQEAIAEMQGAGVEVV